MIDIKLLREHPDLVKENIEAKFQDKKLILVDKILKLDEKWRKEKKKADDLRAKRNKISERINSLIKSGKKSEAKKFILQAKKIPKEIEKMQARVSELENEVRELLLQIPNIIHPSVPRGKDESENKELEKFGKAVIPTYEIFNHAELAERLGGLDLDSSRKTSGNGFYFLKGELARLHSGILSYARDFMIKAGFEYVVPPALIREKVVSGVMSFEEQDAMMYKIEGEDLYLIGTSEHALIGMVADTVFRKGDIPYKITAYSPCFRKEKGAHGIEERGLYRVHQFEKQEMIVICEPEDSYKFFEEMLSLTIAFLSSLDIPLRTLECCSGDLADLKSKSVDVEAWSPRQKKYFEVGSCSNLTDAQSRRLGIKINGGKGNYFAHTLNNTVVASPRILIALLENNQNKDGSVNIPKALQPYMGNLKVIKVMK